MREKIKFFLSSGPLGAAVGVLSCLVFISLKDPAVNTLASVLRQDPVSLAGIVIPLGAFPIYFSGAMLAGYLGGLLGGLLWRRRLGIILGGLLGGLLINVVLTLK